MRPPSGRRSARRPWRSRSFPIAGRLEPSPAGRPWPSWRRGWLIGRRRRRGRGRRSRSRAPVEAARARWAAPRFVDEAPRPASTTPTTGDFEYFVGGGVAAFDCDADGLPDLYFAGGSGPAALFRNDSPSAARCGSRRRRPRRRTSTRSPAPIRSTSTATASPTWRSCARRERPPARPRRLPLRARQRGLGVRRRRRLDDGVQRDVGGRGGAADAGLRQLPRARRDGEPTHRLRRQRAGPPGAGGDGYDAADPADAGLVRAVDAVQRLGPLRPARPAGQQRPPLLRRPATARSSSGGSSRASRRACTPTPTAGAAPIWGMGIASYDVDGDGYPEVYLTSQGDNKLQALAERPDAADLRGHRAERGRARPPTVRRRRRRCRRPPGTPSSRTSTTTASSTCSSRRATSRRRPDYAMRGPEQPALGQPDGTFVEARRGGRDRRLRPRPRRGARRPQPRRPARPRRGRPARERPSCGGTSGPGTPRRPAPLGNWLGVEARPARRRTATRSARGSRSGSATGRQRELTVGGGHVGGQLGWIHFGLGPATIGRGPGHVAGRRGRAVADGRRRPVRDRSSAARRRRTVAPRRSAPMTHAR